MPDTINAGDPGVWGARFMRLTTKEPIKKVPVALTTLALVVTDPAGTATTYAIGDFRNPEVGRYELDRTHALPGIYKGAWTATATFTDEDGNSRSYTAKRKSEIKVAP